MKLNEFKETLKDSSKFNIANKSNQISVNDFLMSQGYHRPHYFRNIAFSVMSLFVVFIFSFYMYLNLTPISSLTIDINPSITVELNRFNRVVNINPQDQEAIDFIEDLNVKNKTIDELFDQIYEKGLHLGYFSESSAYALIGVYAENYEIENKINLLVTANNTLNVLAINQHTESNDLRISTNFSLTYESEYEGGVDASNDYLTGEDAGEVPTYEPVIDSLTAEELLSIVDNYGLSDTQLEVIIYVFQNNDSYLSYEDFIYLVELDISALIDLYSNIN